MFDPKTYAELVDGFPSVTLARYTNARPSNKLSLTASSATRSAYLTFMANSRPWGRFRDYVNDQFFGEMMKMVGLPDGTYSARLEFSFIPWRDGVLNPHVDRPDKVLAIVLPMQHEWNPEWGGCTDLLKPKQDIPLDWTYEHLQDEFDVVEQHPFAPNTANVMLNPSKTWHAVTCHGGDGYRKSVTLSLLHV